MNKILPFIICLLFVSCAQAKVPDTTAYTIKTAEKPVPHTEYNYSSTFSIPLHLQIEEKISTKDKDIFEGKKIYFKAQKTAFYKGKPILKEGDRIEGEIKYIITSGLNGIPYTIIVDNFKIKGIDQNKLMSEYQKNGFNRTPFVLPLKWALTPLPPTGSLTNFIKGGHAKITPKDEITLYYFPNWK